MKRIAVLSDTHGLLRDEVKSQLLGVDCILHAGDVDTMETLKALQNFGECHIVRGNNDWYLTKQLPPSLAVTIEGIRFFLVHNKRDIPSKLSDIDVVIYGHSHQYDEALVNGVLFYNPGSCGPRRFHLDISMGIIEVERGVYRVQKVLLSSERK